MIENVVTVIIRNLKIDRPPTCFLPRYCCSKWALPMKWCGIHCLLKFVTWCVRDRYMHPTNKPIPIIARDKNLIILLLAGVVEMFCVTILFYSELVRCQCPWTRSWTTHSSPARSAWPWPQHPPLSLWCWCWPHHAGTGHTRALLHHTQGGVQTWTAKALRDMWTTRSVMVCRDFLGIFPMGWKILCAAADYRCMRSIL